MGCSGREGEDRAQACGRLWAHHGTCQLSSSQVPELGGLGPGKQGRPRGATQQWFLGHIRQGIPGAGSGVGKRGCIIILVLPLGTWCPSVSLVCTLDEHMASQRPTQGSSGSSPHMESFLGLPQVKALDTM